MKFIVKYSEKHDLDNYLNRIWKNTWVDYGNDNKEYFYRFAEKDFIDQLLATKDKKEAKNVVKEYWKKTLPPSFEGDNEFLIKWFSRILNEESERIVWRLEKVYGDKVPFKEITVYITTCFFNPYNYEERYFMVSRNSNLFGILNTTRHELNHFMFYYYYSDYMKKRGVSFENTEYLKEALAILTSGKKSENEGRSNQIIEIEKFIKNNRNKGVKEIIDQVIEKNFFETKDK